MTITFITGANKGLGYETARRLIEAGHTVYLGARDPERGRAAADVTDDASVEAAAATIREHEGRLDVLINNAGIVGRRSEPEDVTADDLRTVYETNVFGIVRVTRAFLPLLRASEHPVIVNVTSGLGSFASVTNPDIIEGQFATIVYGSSKSAVTMLTVQYAKALPDIHINAVDPGYTATDFNGNSGTQTVEEGTDAIVRLATIGADGPTGTLQNRDGVLGW